MSKFDYNSVRAREARLSKAFDGKAQNILTDFLIFASFSFGIVMILTHLSLGWLFVGLSIAILVFTIWLRVELRHLPNRKEENAYDIISRDLLALLPKELTPLEIANAVTKTRSGIFMVNRYGLLPDYLNIIASNTTATIDQIFDKAFEIREITKSEHVSGAVLMLALVETYQGAEKFISALKLDVDDLRDGVNWFNYISGMIKGMKKTRHDGGLGRDLSFGYTPILQRFAENISRTISNAHIAVNQASSDEVIDEMIKTFSHGGRQNVALIGAEGSGRKTIVYAFANKLLDADSKIPNHLKFRQIFKLDAASLISVASERGSLENLMSQIMGEAYGAKNIILWLDNAQLFFEEGVGSVDISKVILPAVRAGRLRIIFTMEQQRYLEIEARNSQLANALNKVMVPPSTPEETMDIMQDRVPLLELEHDVVYTIWALKEAYRLSEKYIHDMVMPGRALHLLESAAGFAENGIVTAESVQTAIEKTYGVKMRASQDEKARQDLLDMEQLIHQRMIGQENAVKAVSNALRRSAAGVRNEKRPIGTFLFLGPTGVGKTELAKAISEVYFHGEGAIVRLDLNEFVDEGSVQRLIADGATDEMSLTSQVMKNPFSVVLLDEIEKAHPKVLTALLQLLDEGVLRDIKNREVSFRDTIIVATSNAGANHIRESIDSGHDLAELKTELIDALIDSGEFKPEFINRFDEVCVFSPLGKTELAQIFDLILADVNRTLEPQKITVTVDADARDLLADRGYDPKLGARPMRRIVQSSIENIVAKEVLAGNLKSGGEIIITTTMIRQEIGE